MTTSLLNPSYVDLLPGNFKKIRNPTSNEVLEKYDLDLVLLTAYLLEQVDKTFVRFNSSDIAQFERTRRYKDLFPNNSTLSIKDIELFKGYLLFKGTSSDLVLSLKQIGLDATITEKVQSGIIDDIFDIGVYNNVTTDFKFENPTNVTQFGQSVANQDLSGLCKLNIIVNINISDDALSAGDIFNKLSILLVNRLAVYVIIDEVIYKYAISDRISPDTFTEMLGNQLNIVLQDNAYATLSFNNTAPFKFNDPVEYQAGINEKTSHQDV